MPRTSHRLPSLGAYPDRSDLVTAPDDLKGARYSKIGSPDQNGDNLQFLPDMEDDHPMPYYISPDVSLPPITNEPWMAEIKKKNKDYLQAFKGSRKLQDNVTEDLLRDFIQEEVTAIASRTISESQYQENTDSSAVQILEEDLLTPVMSEQIYLVIWSLLFDMARDLTPEEYLDMKENESKLKLDDTGKKALLSHVHEGDDWAKDLSEEKMLSGINWETLIYNYYSYLRQSSLANNVGMHMLQEYLSVQAAGEVILMNGLIDTIQHNLYEFDGQEKMKHPPRYC